MGAKEDFVSEFFTDLPEGVRDFVNTEIPALQPTSSPSDVDGAIIAQGILAHNLNEILRAFQGMTLAAIPLYIGQLNTVNQGLLCAALEFVGGSGDLKIIAPVDSGTYLGFFGVREGEWYSAQVLRGVITSISCLLDDGEAFDLTEDTENPGIWKAEWPTAMGDHSVVFNAAYSDKTTTTETSSFSVSSYSVSPGDGSVVPVNEEFEISIDTQGDEYDSVSVTATDSSGKKAIVALAADSVSTKWVGRLLISIEGAVGLGVTLMGAGIGAAVYQEIQLEAAPQTA